MTSAFASPILTSPNGPTHGPHASTLALGAPLSLPIETFWNSPERPGAAPGVVDVTVEEKLTLVRRWKITSTDTWLAVTDQMIRGEHIRARPAEIALDVRDEALEASGSASGRCCPIR